MLKIAFLKNRFPFPTMFSRQLFNDVTWSLTVRNSCFFMYSIFQIVEIEHFGNDCQCNIQQSFPCSSPRIPITTKIKEHFQCHPRIMHWDHHRTGFSQHRFLSMRETGCDGDLSAYKSKFWICQMSAGNRCWLLEYLVYLEELGSTQYSGVPSLKLT